MKNFKGSLFALAGIGIIVGSIAFVNQIYTQGPKGPTGPTKPVVIVNEPADPVPVTGTVNVGNFETGPLSVRNLDEPGRSPYQEMVSDRLDAGGTAELFYSEVPSGKRLVIKNISGRHLIQPGYDLSSIQLRTGSVHNYFEPRLITEGVTAKVYHVNQETLAFVEAGNRPYIRIGGVGLNALQEMTLSGYFVDVP